MIRSFGNRRTEALFRDQFVPDFHGIARRAKRKLEALNAASRLSDLAVPPSNRLERLRGDLKDFLRSGSTTNGASSSGGAMARPMRFASSIIIESAARRN
jgi:hypothetical protein